MNKFGFDNYSFTSRLQPIFIVLFPVLLAAPIWVPSIYKLGITLIGMVATCGIMLIFSNLSRSFGLKAQDKLVKEWGGMPTTLSLRHDDSTLDPLTTQRYHTFLQDNIPGWVAPSAADEIADTKTANDYYSSASKWLRELTRNADKYPLVLKENTSYGFRRNTFGLKPFGMTSSAVALALGCWSLWGTSLTSLTAEHLPKTIYMVIMLILLSWWTFSVTKEWVRSAAFSYSRALLAACDTKI